MSIQSPIDSKYAPLTHHLKGLASNEINMSFRDIERVVGTPLPNSARRHRAWWSNNPTNSGITHAWLAAGYRTARVDLAGETLSFVRATPPQETGELQEAPSAFEPPQPVFDATVEVRHPVFGCMKGTVTLRPDVDLTEPADPDWGRRAWGAD